MKKIILILFLITEFTSAARVTVAPKQWFFLDCKELSDGFYAADADNCSHNYIECRKNITDYHSCSITDAYDTITAKCVPREELESCKISYRKKEIAGNAYRADFLKRYPNYIESCSNNGSKYSLFICQKLYIACIDGKGWADVCPGNLYFDEGEQKCAELYKIKECYEDTLNTPPCEVLPFGYYGKAKEKKYYRCVRTTVKHECDDGYAFSPETSSCQNITAF